MLDQQGWELAGFLDRLDAWAALENPSDELRRLVTQWIFSRYVDPYQGVQREPGFPNLWHGRVPRAVHPPDRVVVCSYFIYETTRVVACNSFASLTFPA